jgi:hypothetical protein
VTRPAAPRIRSGGVPVGRFNYHCIVCNGPTGVQEHGWHVTVPRGGEGDSPPPEPVIAAAHSECLRSIAVETHDFSEPQPPREWNCVICGEPADFQRGLALLSEFGPVDPINLYVAVRPYDEDRLVSEWTLTVEDLSVFASGE